MKESDRKRDRQTYINRWRYLANQRKRESERDREIQTEIERKRQTYRQTDKLLY